MNFKLKKIQGYGKVNFQTMKQVPFPSSNSIINNDNQLNSNHALQEDLLTWFGFITCGLSPLGVMDANVKSRIKKSLFPSNNSTTDAVLLRLMGFIPPHKILQLLEFTRKFIEKEQVIQEKS